MQRGEKKAISKKPMEAHKKEAQHARGTEGEPALGPSK